MGKHWLNLQHAVFAFESVYSIAEEFTEKLCNVGPENVCAGIFCFPNPGTLFCEILQVINLLIVNPIKLALQISLEAVTREFELGTLGPDQAIYGYEYSKATYQDVKALTKWQYESLLKINTVIEVQHSSMRAHLQERHFAMEQNIGEDIFDSQNAIGQSIIDAQNANGQLIVDARNATSDQHNRMLKWMHDDFPQRICQVYNATGGKCESFIGPLEEDQGSIPITLHWPEDQPTLDMRLQRIESALSIGNIHKKESNVEEKMDEMKTELSAAVKTEISAVQLEMRETKGMMKTEISAVQQEMRETKEMMKTLIDMMQETPQA